MKIPVPSVVDKAELHDDQFSILVKLREMFVDEDIAMKMDLMYYRNKMNSVLSHNHSENTRDIRTVLSAAEYKCGARLSIKKKNKKRNSVVGSGDFEKALVRSIRGIVFSERRRGRKER